MPRLFNQAPDPPDPCCRTACGHCGKCMHDCRCLELLRAHRDELLRLVERHRRGWPTEDVVKPIPVPRGDNRAAKERRLWEEFLTRRKAWDDPMAG